MKLYLLVNSINPFGDELKSDFMTSVVSNKWNSINSQKIY